MQKLFKIFIIVLFFSTATVEAKCSIDSLYNRLNSENISANAIQTWLDQFEPQDRESAVLLLEQIDYFSYNRLISDLRPLHKKLLLKLQKDKFIDQAEKELVFEAVDFSKTYPAKSGDLISYFYRSSNLIRAIVFKNLTDLETDKQDHSNRALVLLEDYVGTGTQFLFEICSKRYHELFNSYKKVYFVVLVATKNAINRFEKLANAEYESLAQDFISIMDIQDEEAKQEVLSNLKRIPKDKIEIVYLHKETPLNDSSRDPIVTAKITTLLNKYNTKRYMGGSFSSFGHSVFFYNCPNNLPEILWSVQSVCLDGTPWTPLFKRVEDVSIYDMSETIPVEDQVW